MSPAPIAPEPETGEHRNIWVRSDPSTTTIPLVDDTGGNSGTQLTTKDSDPVAQSLQHTDTLIDDTNDISSTHSKQISAVDRGEGSITSSGMGNPMSRADVFSGVMVFSVGMLVLIVGVMYYFAKARSLRNRTRHGDIAVDSREGVAIGTEAGRVTDAGDVDLERNGHTRMPSTTATAAKEIVTEKSASFDPHSPSTARLIDYPTSLASSVFAFLKDTHPGARVGGSQVGASSIISKTGNDNINDSTPPDDDTEAPTLLHMPTLTRTKVRSSCKKKSKGIISLFSSATPSSGTTAKSRKEKQKQQKQAALEIARSASAIIIQVQEPSQPASAISLQPYEPTINTTTLSPLNPTRSTTNINHTNNKAMKKTSSHQSTQQMPSTIRSSSVVGLYGSAKSSPNGPMADAASTRAIYCTSFKSAVSFNTSNNLPTTDSSLALEAHPLSAVDVVGAGAGQDSKEIVIASAGLTRLDDTTPSIAVE
ncbi:hypothetical protein BGX23_006545 [Mortierella sp. AD031]|nr:hypothetical protein BGX23_006545 [Mortierella sp. AD031]